MWLLTVAWKDLFRRRMRSIATITGTAIAIGSMVTLVGLSHSFRQSFAELFDKREIDVLVLQKGKGGQAVSVLDEEIGPRLQNVPGVAGVEGALIDATIIDDTSVLATPVQGWHVDSRLFDKLEIIKGRPLQPGDKNRVLLGETLAINYGKKVGDTIEIEVEPFEVVGIFSSFSIYENNTVIVLLDELQRLIDRQGKVSGFAVFLKDRSRRLEEAKRVSRLINDLRDEEGRPLGVEATPAEEVVARSVQFRFINVIAWMTSTIALVISTIGVLNTMMMSVFERTAEIGIFRAVGWRQWRILRLIVYEALLLSVLGGIVGSVAGQLLLIGLSSFPTTRGLIEAHFSPLLMVQGVALGLVIGLVGGLYPAIRAARLAPMEATRHV